MPARSLKALLAGAIDYAGLFPPAELTMHEAVNNYAAYKRSSDAWALARFVVPLARLEEFVSEAETLVPRDASPWRLSVLVGTDIQRDAEAITVFNARNLGCIIDSVEVKAARIEEVVAVASVLPQSLNVFVEIIPQQNMRALMQTIAERGLKAKLRTGGATSSAFPPSDDVVSFVLECLHAKVQFKATAGLHHPIRAMYNLTYAPGSERGKMYGYLNVILAAAFMKNGMQREDAEKILEEERPAAFTFDDDAIRWNGFSITTEQLHEARTTVILAFGSCSFREPIDDLKALKIF